VNDFFSRFCSVNQQAVSRSRRRWKDLVTSVPCVRTGKCDLTYVEEVRQKYQEGVWGSEGNFHSLLILALGGGRSLDSSVCIALG
jgi:hypothetical protein